MKSVAFAIEWAGMGRDRREEVFRMMFWHEEFYSHKTATMADGWKCLDCDAGMTAPPRPQSDDRKEGAE